MNKKRMNSLIMVLIIIFSIFPNKNNTIRVNAASEITTEMINQVCNKYGYAVDKYWTYKGESNKNKYTASDTKDGKDGYKGYTIPGGSECWAFARFLASQVVGVNVGGAGWQKIKASKVESLKVGDVVCTGDNYNVSQYPHSAVVYKDKGNGKFEFIEIWTGSFGHVIKKGGFNGSSQRNTLKALRNYAFTDGNGAYVYRFNGDISNTIKSIKASNDSTGASVEFEICNPAGIKKLQISAWSTANGWGVGKAKWYNATLVSGSKYKAHINLSDFGWTTGNYKCSVWVNDVRKYQDYSFTITHTHNYSIFVKNTKQPTCTENGSAQYKCVCGATTIKNVAALGHQWQIVPYKAPGCTTYGNVSYKKCSRCGTQTNALPYIKPNGHKEVIDEAVAATCTTTGLTEGKHCSVCSKVIVAQKEIPALGHTEVIDKAVEATCTKSGLTEGSHCSVCEEIIKIQEEIPAVGHTWDEGKVTRESTETTTGVKTFTCTVCQETRTEDIPVKSKVEPTTKPTDLPAQQAHENNNPSSKSISEDGVGIISADGKTLTDSEGDKYYTNEYLTYAQLTSNLSVADKASGGKYKLTKITKKSGKVVGGTVTYMKPYNKNCTKATIPATVKIGGVTFKVTEVSNNAFNNCKNLKKVIIGKNVTKIGSKAFYGCKKLKSIIIKTTKLKKIGSKAFKGINSKAKFKVPKKKLSKYKKMIKKAKAPKKAKITK